MILRAAQAADAEAMADLLNEIIRIGGTSAHEVPLNAETLRDHFVDGPDVATTVIAEDEGQVLGWQSLGMWQGQLHIGTFVRDGLQGRGIGSALFGLTCTRARRLGLTEMIAHIRADNVAGLAYYQRMGFRDIGGNPGFALKDGTVVGQIYRRFELGDVASRG